MLSYQHIFHAGNLADVQKHAALAWVLAYLTVKDKPISYIETHSGRALYDLASDAAQKTGEAAKGIENELIQAGLGSDHPYLRALNRVRDAFGPRHYPGSPWIAGDLLRNTDHMHLAELHPYTKKSIDNVLASTKENLNEWITVKANVKEDFKKFHNLDVDELDGLAIMSDTDNSKLKAIAYYQNIYFSAD